MNATTEYFEKNGYVILKDALTLQQCDEFVTHMFNLHKEGKLVNDDQCPLSDAIYGDPLFDDLLQKFAKPIGDSVGRTLLPTYTYARIYRPGEILKRHKDRPACEISATLTLGHKANKVWPIFFNEEKEIAVDLQPGELAVYKGCEILHWRPPFKGEWHVQLFLHYVDANGPHKDHARDGRPAFGMQKTKNINQIEEATQKALEYQNYNSFSSRIYPNCIIIPNNDCILPGYYCINSKHMPDLMFSEEECKQIINLTEDSYHTSASVGGNLDNSKIARDIRSADIYNIEYTEENAWIFAKVAKAVMFVNTTFYDYDIAGIRHGIQLIHYSADQPVKGHYNWHVDAGNGEVATRKISFTAQLSDPRDYTGCELIINNHTEEIIGTGERGSIHMFPSYMPHKVAPIISGERYALVIWIHGSRRFR
jgi:predicted 2-oxoglutarate/Fe(II)-dependent dioxygenase YbiX